MNSDNASKFAIQLRIKSRNMRDKLITIFEIQGDTLQNINENLYLNFNNKYFGMDYTYTLTVNRIIRDKDNNKCVCFIEDRQLENVVYKMKDYAEKAGMALQRDYMTCCFRYDLRFVVDNDVDVNIGTVYYFNFEINK